ncbi:MAG: hypothetical protein J7K23_07255 [Thermoproteales archaeon]|nr:hypothetical protein [Thermoproteales archaeon]
MLDTNNYSDFIIKKASLLMLISTLLIIFYRNFTLNIVLLYQPVIIYLDDVLLLITSSFLTVMILSLFNSLKTLVIVKWREKSFYIISLIKRTLQLVIIFLYYISLKGLYMRISYTYEITDINLYDIFYQFIIIILIYFTIKDLARVD